MSDKYQSGGPTDTGRPVSTKLTLDKLQVVTDDISSVFDGDSTAVLVAPVDRPASVADWVEIGESLGAERVEIKYNDIRPVVVRVVDEPGTYLVYRIEEK